MPFPSHFFVPFRLTGADWEDPDDPSVIAENELLGAAASIYAAAKKLANLRPRQSSTQVKLDFVYLSVHCAVFISTVTKSAFLLLDMFDILGCQ